MHAEIETFSPVIGSLIQKTGTALNALITSSNLSEWIIPTKLLPPMSATSSSAIAISATAAQYSRSAASP